VDCEDWETYTACTTNSSDPPCICLPGYYPNGTICTLCEARCSVCYGGTAIQCTECKADNFLQWESTFCLNRCPTNYTTSGNVCEKPATDASLLYRFDSGVFATARWTDADSGIVATDSGTEPVYLRGIWFDGSD
jgi:hypothetical protein